MYSPYKNEYQIWHRSFDRELAARLEAIKLRCLPYADMLEQIKQYSQKLGSLCYSSLIPTSATLFIFECGGRASIHTECAFFYGSQYFTRHVSF